MVKVDVAARITDLRARIVEADRRYYLDDAPELSDADYDALLRELRALEDANPELITDDSPTRTVRGATSSTFAAVVHRVPKVAMRNVNWVI